MYPQPSKPFVFFFVGLYDRLLALLQSLVVRGLSLIPSRVTAPFSTFPPHHDSITLDIFGSKTPLRDAICVTLAKVGFGAFVLACTRKHTHTHALTHTLTCIQSHAHTHTHTHRKHTHAHAYTHTYMHTYAHARARTYTITCTHTHARAHAHTRTHTDAYARTHTHTRTHTCAHTGRHSHTHAHTCTHAHARTHTHTYTHMMSPEKKTPRDRPIQKKKKPSSCFSLYFAAIASKNSPTNFHLPQKKHRKSS